MRSAANTVVDKVELSLCPHGADRNKHSDIEHNVREQ